MATNQVTDLKKKVTYCEKRIKGLEEANDYLHGLREIFVLESMFKEAQERKFQKLSIALIHQYNHKNKEYKYFYELNGLQWMPNQEYKSVRYKAETLEELEGQFNGNTIEDDGDLL